MDRTKRANQIRIKVDFRGLTNGILEALSFHTANNPKDAKKLKPPQSQANASYCYRNSEIKIKNQFNLFRRTKTQKAKRVNLSNSIGDTIYTGLRERCSIIPNQFVVHMELKITNK